MINENGKTKKDKVLMTSDHKKVMKWLYIVAIVIVSVGILLSGLAWGGIINSSL